MTTKTLIFGAEFENDTYYLADKDFYEITTADTVNTTDLKYFYYSAGQEKSYYDTCFWLKGKKNITLDFGGATLFLKGEIQPFILDECENVTIKNVIVENERSYTTEMEILERGEDYVVLKRNPLEPCRIDNGTLVEYSNYWETRRYETGPHFIQTFDKETQKGCGLMCAMIGFELKLPERICTSNWKTYIAEDAGENIILRGVLEDAWQVGKILAFSSQKRIRDEILMMDCENITIENYRVINGLWGMLPIHCKDVFFKGIKYMYDERSRGIMSNSADVIHSINCSGKLEITDSVIGGMMDDAINLHSCFYTVDSFSENKLTINCASWVTAYCTTIEAGEEIAVYKPKTLELEATYKVIKKEIVDANRLCITVDKPVAEHEIGALAENISAQADITIKNSKFYLANSHIRLQSRGKVVMENCVTELPVLLTGDAVFWYEASPCKDVTIKNVTFLEERANIRLIPEIIPTEKAPYYHENIKVTDCSFESPIPMEGRQGGNIEFLRNKNSLGLDMKLRFVNCGGIKTDCAEVENKIEKKDSLNENYR